MVIGCESFGPLGGTQTYTLTLAEHLERLGHDVTVVTRDAEGEMTGLARSRGVRVLEPGMLPTGCDGVVAQDAAMSYDLASRYPRQPRIYVAHSSEFISQLPPQAPGAASALVVMNGRIERWCRSLAHRPEIVRLHQPIDLERFGRLEARSPNHHKLVMFGNQQGGPLWRGVHRACHTAGFEAELLGRHGRLTMAPEAALAEADVVVGIGRCAVEGMAARRAVYVAGIAGTDGWITPESYGAIEADGFSGRATQAVFDEGRLVDDLARFSLRMGEQGRDLAYRYHDASAHAADVVALLERLGQGASTPAPAHGSELARLVRVQGQLESRAAVFAAQARAARAEAARARAQAEEGRGGPQGHAPLPARRPARPSARSGARGGGQGSRAKTSSKILTLAGVANGMPSTRAVLRTVFAVELPAVMRRPGRGPAWRTKVTVAAATTLALLAAGGSQASAAEVLSTEVTAGEAVARSCIDHELNGGRGYAQRSVTAPDSGWITARLTAASGDWDVALFDEATGRRVAGSAFFGASEIAQSFVTAGTRLTAQACRREGGAETATLTVENKEIEPTKPQKLSLVRVVTPSPARKDELTGLGLDLTEHGRDGFVEVVLHGAKDAETLREAKFTFTTEVSDLVAQSVRQRRAESSTAARGVQAKAFPSGRTGTYRRLDDYNNEMKTLAEQNPTLVKPITLANKTFTGRDVNGIEITENVTASDGKPIFLNMGVHHGREWPSGEHAMEWAYELVNGYKANNARVRGLMASTRTIVIPIVNPDGFNTSREANPSSDGGRRRRRHPGDGQPGHPLRVPAQELPDQQHGGRRLLEHR